MEYPRRGYGTGEEEYPHRGYGSGKQENHHHHHHHLHTPPPQHKEEDQQLTYGEESYPPFHHHHPDRTPDAYASHTHAHSPPGPYGTHTSSGPYFSHLHHPAPSDVAAYPLEPVQYLAHSGGLQLPQGQVMRVFCKGDSAFNLAVERDTVMMVPANSEDESQQWIKDSTYGIRVKDNYGSPAFSLVNKKTQKILKHSKQKGHQVLLMDYRPDIKDDDILWSESQDFGEGYKTVRSASDTLLNLTVFEGAKKIRNGSALVLDTWHKGDHQLWKLFPL